MQVALAERPALTEPRGPQRATDMVLAALADSEAALLEQLAYLTAERDAWQLLAKESIEKLHESAVDRDKRQRRHEHVLEEFRAHRARVMREAVTA